MEWWRGTCVREWMCGGGFDGDKVNMSVYDKGNACRCGYDSVDVRMWEESDMGVCK